jgi:hypothetical protein
VDGRVALDLPAVRELIDDLGERRAWRHQSVT